MDTGSTGAELERLASLRDRGVLTEEEFQAQKAAVLRGDQPVVAAPAGKQRSKAKNGAIGCVAILAILLVIGLVVGSKSGGGSSTPAATPAADAPAPTPVTAKQLARAYGANEARAQSDYGDRPLLVTGTVGGVDLDFTDKPFVKLQTDNELLDAQAKLIDADVPKAKSLNKGSTVKLLCQGVSEVMGTPMLNDCALQG